MINYIQLSPFYSLVKVKIMLYKISVSTGIMQNIFTSLSFEPTNLHLTRQPPLRQRRKGVVKSTDNGIRLPVLQMMAVIRANTHFRKRCKSQNKRGYQGPKFNFIVQLTSKHKNHKNYLSKWLKYLNLCFK